MINTLSKRLSLAREMIPHGLVLMDIGADMGLLSLSLAADGFKIYASENKKGPFNALINNTKQYKGNNLQCIFTDGIDILPQDVNALILLGMGGKTIFDILSRHEEKLSQIEYILMEPQSETKLPISYVLQQGYENISGCYVFEKRYYPLMLFKKTKIKKQYNEAQLLFGPYMLENKDSLLFEFLHKEEERIDALCPVGQKNNESYLNVVKEALNYEFKTTA